MVCFYFSFLIIKAISVYLVLVRKSGVNLQTLFDSHQFVGPSQSKKTFSSSVQKDANMDMNEIQVNVNAKADGKSNKRLSVERIYQKKTQIEHVLLRPDTYIGSVENITQVNFLFCISILFSSILLSKIFYKCIHNYVLMCLFN